NRPLQDGTHIAGLLNSNKVRETRRLPKDKGETTKVALEIKFTRIAVFPSTSRNVIQRST
ncbi:hypothetical protein XI08_10255, partial [Bradyrhizobium sp. CCBAU 11361]|nr:hypothetical protein [Bradyrhizobium sp. CCBAU 11361]